MVLRAAHHASGVLDVAIDYISRALITKPVEHQMTHDGLHFVALSLFEEVGDTDVCVLRIKTPIDRYMHAVFSYYTGTGGIIKVVKDSTLTHVIGNAIPIINRNDSSVKSSTVQEICINPGGTETSADVLIPAQAIGSTERRSAAPGGNRDSQEYILDADTVYALVFTSGAANNIVNLGIDFYETDNTLDY